MIQAGETEIVCEMEHLPLPRGNYCLWVGILDRKGDILPWHPARRFEVSGPAQHGWSSPCSTSTR